MRREDILQFHAAQWLRANNIAFIHVPNEGKRSAREAARLIALGLQPGAHDLILFLPDGVFLIELKTIDGKVSQHQKNWHERLSKMQYRQTILRAASPDDLISQLAELLKAHIA